MFLWRMQVMDEAGRGRDSDYRRHAGLQVRHPAPTQVE